MDIRDHQTLAEKCQRVWKENDGIALIAGTLFLFYALDWIGDNRRYTEERNTVFRVMDHINTLDGSIEDLTRDEKITFLRSTGYTGGFDTEYPIDIIHRKDRNLGHFGVFKNPFVAVHNGPHISYEIPRANLMKYILDQGIKRKQGN